MADDMGKKGQQSSQLDPEQHRGQQSENFGKGQTPQPKKDNTMQNENEDDENQNRDRQRRAS
jgi:hypothetical protein